jgi:rhodanese-related sulfurtransferase
VAAADQAHALEIDPGRVVEWLREEPPPQLIDVRERYEREAGHIARTRHIELTELSSQAESVQRGRPVVFYCRVGSRSLLAAQAFHAAGFDAYSMRGGLVRWAGEGHPLSPPGGYVADH